MLISVYLLDLGMVPYDSFLFVTEDPTLHTNNSLQFWIDFIVKTRTSNHLLSALSYPKTEGSYPL